MEFSGELLSWFRENGRVLPWRGKKNAYYTWLSEIMLQQTRVEAVKGYFFRFIERFPDIKSLAFAEEEEVLGGGGILFPCKESSQGCKDPCREI